MKNRRGKMKQMLSVLLAAAMLVTSVPQVSMTAYAAEQAADAENGASEQADTVTAETGAGDGQAAGKDGTSEDGQTAGEDGTSEDGQTVGEDGTSEDGQTAGEDGTSEDGQTAGENGTSEDGQTAGENGTSEDGQTAGEDGASEDDQTTGEDGTSEDDQVTEEKAAADVTEEENKEVQEETYEVTFCTDHAEITDVEVNGSASSLSENQIAVAAGSKLSFQVSANGGYEVTEVKAGETPLSADAEGVYTIESVTGAMTVTATAAQMHEITFQGEHFRVTNLKVNRQAASLSNNSIAVPDKSYVDFEVEPEDGYKVISVTIVGSNYPMEPDSDGIYYLDEIPRSLELVVKTQLETAHTVRFTGNCYDVIYTYINGDFIKVENKEVGVPDKAELTFELRAVRGCRVVSVSIEGQSGTLSPDASGKYKIENIEEDLVINVVTEDIPEYKITIVGENAGWDARYEESDGTGTNFESNLSSYEVPEGNTFFLKPFANDGYRLGKITVGDTEYTPNVNNGWCRFENITEPMTINVETIKFWEVGFTYEKSEAKVSIVGADGKEEAYDGTTTLKLDDKQSLKFKVTPDTCCSVEKVVFVPQAEENSAEEGQLEASEVPITLKDGYYELTSIQSSGKIRIDTKVAEDANIIKIKDFAYANEDDSFDLSAVEIPITVDGKAVKPGDTIRTKNTSVKLKIDTETCAYDAKAELVSGETKTPYDINKSDEREISFSADKREAALTLYVAPKKQFRLDYVAKQFTYTIGGEKVSKKAGSEDIYVIGGSLEDESWEKFTVDVTAERNSTYEPKVMLGDDVLEAKSSKASENDKSVVYSYEIDPEELYETTESEIVFLHILQEEKKGYLILEGESLPDAATLKVSADGQYLSALDSKDKKAVQLLEGNSGLVYVVSPKAKVSITAESNRGWKLTSAQAQSEKNGEWSKPKTISIKNAGFSCSLTASGMDKLTITAKVEPRMIALLRWDKKGGYSEGEVEPVKGVYYVETGKTYVPALDVADLSILARVSGEITSGNEQTATVYDSAAGYFTIDATDAGKTLKVIMKYQDETFAEFKLYVRPCVTEIKVKGVSGKGELTQQIGSEKEYEITLKKPKNALTYYSVVRDGEYNGITADITGDGKLQISTKNAKANAQATFTIKAWNGTEYVKVEGGTIIVKTTEPKLPKPTVKSVSANDVSVTLLLDSKTPEQTGENVKYRVTITPSAQKGKERPAEISAAPIVKEYVWEAKETQQIVVSAAEEGKGKGWKFEVTAEVIYQPGAESAEETKCFTSAASKKLVVSTKDACYETNLKFKQNAKSKKLYTGQTAELGTVQFSKNTTFKENLTAKDVTAGLADGEKLELWFEGDKLYAEAAQGSSSLNKLLGAHVIWIAAAAPDNAISSIAEVKVTVIPGIGDMTITGGTDALYKQNKKAASMKFGLTYEYAADSGIAPATKKAVWSIKDADGNAFEPGDPLYGMITVKNGNVTVNKNYVVSSNPEENRFCVCAQAADYDGNTVCTETDWIEITAQKAVVGEVLLLGGRYEEYKGQRYVPIAKNGDTITADMLKEYPDCYVAVKRAGTKNQSSYTYGEICRGENGLFIPQWNLDFTTSGKGLAVNEYGEVVSAQAGASVTIKAQTLDGSKQTATLKLKLDYGKEQELGLYVILQYAENIKVDGSSLGSYAYYEALADSQGKRTISYYGIPGHTIAIIGVMDAAGGSLNLASKGLYRYDLKADGVMLEPLSGSDGAVCGFNHEGKDVKITLTDSLSGEKMSVTLHNDIASQQTAPEITADSNGLKDGFAAYDEADRPKLTLKLPEKTGGYKDTCLMLTPKMEDMAKKKDGYNALYDEIIYNDECINYTEGLFKVEKDGTVTIPFGIKNGDTGLYETNLTAGTYEWGACLCTYTEGSESLIPQTEMTTIKVTVKKENVKASFKFPSSVQLKKEPGAFADLKLQYTPKDMQYEVIEVLDTVAGGEKNDFTKYFEIVENKQKTGYILKLKDNVTEEELKKIDKKDLTGYVLYQANTKDHCFQKQDKVKITVKLK